MPENADFIKKFSEAVFGEDCDSSTKRKTLGHLFYYEDSLLEFKSRTINDYNLGRHIDFFSEKFLELKDPSSPGGWLEFEIEIDETPGRARQRLQADSKLREFVKDVISNVDIGSSINDYCKRDLIIKHIDNIGSSISKRKIFEKLTKLETQVFNEKQNAKEELDPSRIYKEQNLVKNWLDSETAKEEELKCMKIYQDFLDGKPMGDKKFVHFANNVRFNCALVSKDRTSSYSYTNEEFNKRKCKWLPEYEVGDNTLEDRFKMLPENWNTNVPPEPGKEPTCWVITVGGVRSGPGAKRLKRGRSVEVILNKRCNELCLMYKDMKMALLDTVDGKDPFFVNFKNKPLAPLQRSKGTLLDKVASACELSDPTVNSLRRAGESLIQASPLMKNSVENLQGHSGAVGRKYYDKSRPDVKAQYISQVSCMESSQELKVNIPEAVKRKREIVAEKEKAQIVENAKLTLKKTKGNRKQTQNSKCRLLHADREFLQEIFSNVEILQSIFPPDVMCSEYLETFPGNEL